MAVLDAVLDDGTGRVVLRWWGRRSVAGVVVGTALRAEGTVAAVHGRLVIVNPLTELARRGPGPGRR
jgi:hypothetical protein